MTTIQKNEIIVLIDAGRKRLGSQNAVANACGVSEATISQMRNRNWEKIKDAMWRKVGAALGWKTTGWQTVETENTRLLFATYSDSKRGHMWQAVSAHAGSGKTTSAQAYASAHRGTVFYIQAREWPKRKFLRHLGQRLGLKISSKDHTEEMIVHITAFFLEKAGDNPLLIIDEADKLHPEAIRTLIPLYNELKDTIGVVIQGTPNLKRQFNIGKQWEKKGYAELASRFGTEFISLPGLTQHDVYAVCQANGVTGKEDKREAWKRLEKTNEAFAGVRTIRTVDARRLERIIKNKLFTLSTTAQ